MRGDREPMREASLDVLEEGDAPIEVSAARAALATRDFRILWLGILASGVGTWMQSVTLGAFAWELTESPTFVSVIVFAQLGPALALSLVGGALADMFDRRRLILVAQVEQVVATLALALVATQDDPNRVALLLAVFAIGVGHTLNAPAQSALLPSLVERRHLSGAVSLTSAQMNGARVIGPAIGGVLYPALGAAAVFTVNAFTYAFAIAAVLAIRSPSFTPSTGETKGLRRVLEGIAMARTNLVVRRVLITIVVFSLLSLPFIGQMPTIAAENLGMRTKSWEYGLLYATFGIGAMIGALSIGTFLSRHDLRRVAQFGLGAFALLLLTFGLLSDAAPAYPVVAMLGFAYFATVTSLTTVLQEEVDDAYRGRVLSLWQMGFAGMLPLGVMAAGPIAEAVSMRFVLVYGAVAAAGLAWYARVSHAE